MPQSELEGRCVRLRQFEIDDVDDVFAYASDPEVSRYLDWEPHRMRQDSARYIQSCLEADPQRVSCFAVEHSPTGRVIGAFELRVVDPVRRVGELGYSLARAYWGAGFNLEAGQLLLEYAFGDAGMLRVQGICDVENRRSYRTMEKLGMVRERLLSRYRVRNGRGVDFYLYSILWREWAREASRRARALATAVRLDQRSGVG